MMSYDFVASPASAELVSMVSKTMPANPFVTCAYVEGQRTLGCAPWVLGGTDAAGDRFWAIGFLRAGRVGASLEFPSMPPLAEDAPFWDDLMTFCRARGVTDLSVHTFATPGVHIPPLPGEQSRIDRVEFVLPARSDNLWSGMRKGHRYEIAQARKHGIAVRRGCDDTLLDEHFKLHRLSMLRRRERGEVVEIDSDERGARALIRSGAAELAQAVHGDQVLASLLVLRSANCGYAHSSGNSPAGMSLGASQFLWYEVALALSAEGAIFNLGGTQAHEEGLRRFKQGFGADALPMHSVHANLARGLRAGLLRVAALIRRHVARQAVARAQKGTSDAR